ncbi:MAG: OmpH/Skp family outer membrane protein [Sulfuricaulis sp.]
MKKFALLTLLIVCFTGVAAAAEAPTIGYVNLHTVLLESKVGKRNKAELGKLIQQKEGALAAEQSKLQAMQQAFQKDQLLMTDAQKQEKQSEFQTKAQAYQNMVNDAKDAVNKQDNAYASKSLADIKPIVAALAKEMKLSIVFNVNELGVIYSQDGMDLTQKVIERYNASSK